MIIPMPNADHRAKKPATRAMGPRSSAATPAKASTSGMPLPVNMPRILSNQNPPKQPRAFWAPWGNIVAAKARLKMMPVGFLDLLKKAPSALRVKEASRLLSKAFVGERRPFSIFPYLLW